MSARKILLELYAKIRKCHDEVYHQLADLEVELKRFDPTVICDAVYALKKTNELVDDTRKSINKKISLAEKFGCVLSVQMSEEHLYGRWSTGTPQSTEQPGVPHPETEPEAYTELMSALGASPELIAARTLRPSFDGIAAHMQWLGENGKPVPPGLKNARMIPRYAITVRGRNRQGMDGILAAENGLYDAGEVTFKCDDWPTSNDYY